ncbi:hypothetical protein QV08_10735, partial [Gallibacterium salpingitidis]|uniref:hypothetical protein n=1 Tax=Gallibacterium salpingitidis TaxID=505341 RepID=UPI000805FC78
SASESASTSESASESESLSALDRDNDGYLNEVEDTAGSNPDDHSSTPKTVAEDLYKQAETFLNDLNNEKTSLETNGFTKAEVNHLKEQLVKLEELKQDASDASQYVKESDGRQDLIDKINKLTFTVPDITNDADTKWVGGFDYDMGDGAGKLNTKSFSDFKTKDVVDLSKSEQSLVIDSSLLKDPDSNSPTIIGPTEWTSTISNPSGGGYTEYKVENGKIIFKVNPEKAKLLSGNTNEIFILETDDGSILRAVVSLHGDATTTSIVNINVVDDVNFITGNIPNNGYTNDTKFNKIQVLLNQEATEEIFVKLSIKDKQTGQMIATKVQNITSGKELLFDMSSTTLNDGSYIVEAVKVADSSGKELFGEAVIKHNVTVDTVKPTIETSYEIGADGTTYVKFHTSEAGISYSEDKAGNINNTFATREEMTGDLRFEAKAGKYYFFDKAGNYTEVAVVPPLVLARLTTNMTTETGPNNWMNDVDNEQKSSPNDSLKTTEGHDNLIVYKRTGQEYGGFIDGGTGRGSPAILLDTAGGNDTINARGIGGHTNITTGTGNDKITLEQGIIGYGPNSFYYGGMNGPQTIDMGTGDDTLTVGKFTMWNNAESVNSFYKTTTRIFMGDGKDTINVVGTIWADSDAGEPYSNYINLGAGDDIMNVAGKITDTFNTGTNVKYSSNIIDLGKGNDQFTANDIVDSNTLILSDDSSTITLNGEVRGRTTFLLGDGVDNLTFKNNVNISGGNYETISPVVATYLENKLSTSPNSGWYKASEAKLDTLSIDMKPFIDVGNGNNIVRFEKDAWGIELKSGNGNDDIQFLQVLGRSSVSTGAGDDKVLIDNWYSANDMTVDLGNGRDTLLLHSVGKQQGNSPKVFKNVVDGGVDYDVVTIQGSDTITLNMYAKDKVDAISLVNVEEVNLNGTTTVNIGTSGALKGVTIENKSQYSGDFFVNGSGRDIVNLEHSQGDNHQWRFNKADVKVDAHEGTYREYTYTVDNQDTSIKLYVSMAIKTVNEVII